MTDYAIAKLMKIAPRGLKTRAALPYFPLSFYKRVILLNYILNAVKNIY